MKKTRDDKAKSDKRYCPIVIHGTRGKKRIHK